MTDEQKIKTVDDYIDQYDGELKSRLMTIRKTIQNLLPDKQECISWGMPTYKGKHNIIHFAAQKNHIGLYPGAEAIIHFEAQLKQMNYKYSKGAVQLPNSQPLPIELIKEITLWCRENNE